MINTIPLSSEVSFCLVIFMLHSLLFTYLFIIELFVILLYVLIGYAWGVLEVCLHLSSTKRPSRLENSKKTPSKLLETASGAWSQYEFIIKSGIH